MPSRRWMILLVHSFMYGIIFGVQSEWHWFAVVQEEVKTKCFHWTISITNFLNFKFELIMQVRLYVRTRDRLIWKHIWAPGKADQKGSTITKGWNHCSTTLGVHTCTQGISCIWEWINTLAFVNSCLTGRFPGLKPFSVTCQTGVFWLNETMSEHVHVYNK